MSSVFRNLKTKTKKFAKFIIFYSNAWKSKMLLTALIAYKLNLQFVYFLDFDYIFTQKYTTEIPFSFLIFPYFSSVFLHRTEVVSCWESRSGLQTSIKWINSWNGLPTAHLGFECPCGCCFFSKMRGEKIKIVFKNKHVISFFIFSLNYKAWSEQACSLWEFGPYSNTQTIFSSLLFNWPCVSTLQSTKWNTHIHNHATH